ncbi:hypothetical protein B7494_g5144 [Chlorociboria aeruginascens]|nr:hypothetical protein B7494_g5144 [Chlorociboria aeruginascens]
MPPSQPILASRICGFVCRSCLSKLQQPQRPPWPQRGFSKKAKLAKPKEPKDRAAQERLLSQDGFSIKYFDQGPNGELEENVEPDDAEMEALDKQVQDNIKAFEERTGEKFVESEEEWSGSIFPKVVQDDGLAESIGAKVDNLQAELDRLKVLRPSGSLTAEDRTKLRAALFKIDAEDMPKLHANLQSLSSSDPTAAVTSDVKVAETDDDHMVDADKEIPPDVENPEADEDLMATPDEHTEHTLIPLEPYSASSTSIPHIASLNSGLYSIFSQGTKIGPSTHKAIWKSYMMSRAVLLQQPDNIPDVVWSMLWRVVQTEDQWNEERMAHIKRLGEDMIRAGAALDTFQRLLFIESLFMEGDRQDAIEEWSKMAPSEHTDFSKQYWEIGARMFSLVGQIEQAAAAADTLFKLSAEPATARILFPLIEACLAVKDDHSSVNMAWSFYIRLRVRLGPEIEMEDYDAVISLFFAAQQPEFALAVFKDMMLTGDEFSAHQDSTILYRAFLDVSDASLKSGQQKFKTIAEEMAWRMIRTRIDFVERRRMPVPSFGSLIRPVMLDGKPNYYSISTTPPATIETYCVLLEQYRRTDKEKLELELCDTLSKAEIKPNTALMNILLASRLRQHQRAEGWKLFRDLVEGDNGLVPDFETYIYLWRIMKQAVDPVFQSKERFGGDTFPSFLELFAEMISRASSLTQKEPMPRELYDIIIKCFGLKLDQVATMVALRTMQQIFHMYPSEDTGRSIVLQIARTSERIERGGRRSSRLNWNKATRERVNKVTMALAELRKLRIDALLEKGLVFEELDEDAKRDEALELLIDLLRHVAQARVKDFRESMTRAAQNMGVPEYANTL